MKHHYYYLSSPYSHPDPAVRQKRFHAVCQTASGLIDAGLAVYVPIAMTHPIEVENGSKPFEVWLDLDMPLLERSSGLIELKLPGWMVSKGMRRELAKARDLGLPVMQLDPEGLVESALLADLVHRMREDAEKRNA